MKKKIFQSIMLVAGGVLLASLVIIMGFLYDYFGSVEERQLENQMELAAQGVETGGKTYLEGLSAARYRLTWVDADGTVLYDTRAEAETMENHAGRQEIAEALENAEGKSQRYSTTLLEKTLYYAQRLPDGTVLRISVSHATAWLLALGMLQPVLLVLLLALILSGVLAGQVSGRIMEPLNRLDLDKPLENEEVYEELAPLLGRINRQRRQIERQLRELQRKNDEFTQITRSMNEGLVLLNQKGVIVSINPAALRLFHGEEDCVGKDFLTLERSSEVSEAIQTALAEGRSEILLKRGEREYQLDVGRIESGGAVVGAVLLAFDVTERSFAERSRREFTANVSHELKTPLQSILGSAELMENGLVKAEDMPRFVGHIRSEAERLMTLIGDVIRLSQLDESAPLPMEEVDLREIAREAAETLQAAAEEKSVTLRVIGDAVPLQSVPGLLREIVFNLCDNAIRYNTEGGSVEVRVESRGRGARLTVTDSGVGIPPEQQERVFERFYRVDKSRSSATGGTGLGLSIVKHAVQYLGGRIELRSQVGKGTTVEVEL